MPITTEQISWFNLLLFIFLSDYQARKASGAVLYMCVGGYPVCLWLCHLSITFWNCSDNCYIFSVSFCCKGPGWLNELGVGLSNNSYKPITIRRRFVHGFVNYEKGCTRLAAASDKVYQLLAHGRWFSPGTPASSTTKTDRHGIAEILLKVALNTKKSNQIKSFIVIYIMYCTCVDLMTVDFLSFQNSINFCSDF